MKNFTRFSLIYIMIVFALHLMPVGSVASSRLLSWIDASHLLHLAMFLPWAFVGRGFVVRTPEGQFRRGMIWLVLGLLTGALAEGGQFLIPERTVSGMDFLCNVSGVALGFLPAIVRRPRVYQRPL